jgi:hypothetical protein
MSSPPVFCWVRVTRSLVLCVCFVDRCLSFVLFLLAIVLSVILITPLVSSHSSYVNFPIVNFPFICSYIQVAPAYGIYISQLMQYSRACGSYHDFLDRAANKETT